MPLENKIVFKVFPKSCSGKWNNCYKMKTQLSEKRKHIHGTPTSDHYLQNNVRIMHASQ